MSKLTRLLVLFTLAANVLIAQVNPLSEGDPPITIPKDHAWELGIQAGHLFSAGNIDFKPGYGVGLTMRRALDYVFSMRISAMYGTLQGEYEY